MSLIGQVFNKALQKNISVYISESGEGYKRLTSAIDGAKVKGGHVPEDASAQTQAR
ncbi:hypothetical protein Daus18300_000523 [Diaporthe australafricana]|uniref:Uncharacterized protein n=1 Tax=Diaporthe australafricana TaxID=127596 RepID=A0ABR3Y4K5_9PEZI